MGTLVRIQAFVPESMPPPRVFGVAFRRIAQLERRLSSYLADSEVRQVERRAWRHAVPVSQDLSALLTRACALARASNGTFDPTLGRLTRLLREPRAGTQGAAPEALAAARRDTGWQHLEFSERGSAVYFKRRGLALDLGGIAKGYIADEAIAAIARLGIKRAIVAVAGDIAIGNPPPGRSGWKVAVDAAGERGTPERTLLLRNAGVSTSGGRERSYVSAGRRCSHILGVGGTCTAPTNAVTVVASDATLADGLATALTVAGPANAGGLLGRYPGARAYWVRESIDDALPRDRSAPPNPSQR